MVVFPAVLSYFLFDGLAYFCILYSVFFSPFPDISRRFVIRALVGDDTLDFCGLLIGLATLDALCWIMSVMVSFTVSISSSSCSVSNRILNLESGTFVSGGVVAVVIQSKIIVTIVRFKWCPCNSYCSSGLRI